jgi:alanine-glyoxylate transaminase/serine-glyoxylate transaminase/serine-pyruvate transaminase
MTAPTVSHLDPVMQGLLDKIRARLERLFGAADGSFACAISGTGTAGMEAVVANLVREGTRVVALVNGYFGARLAEMCERYGASVTRLSTEWGRSCDPDALRRALGSGAVDLVTIVHAETSTGVLNPVRELAGIAHEQNALALVDAVTSFCGHPLDVGTWNIDACYTCSQKCIGAPSGLAPIIFGPRALERAVPSRSFYFDLALLREYWLERKYHHTMSSALACALAEALAIVEEEGLEPRWARHERNHRALVESLGDIGLRMLPPEGERLWTLNAVCVPDSIDEAAVRRFLLAEFNIEIGGGLGPLSGKIWRVGLMGESSAPALVVLLTAALRKALAVQRSTVHA